MCHCYVDPRQKTMRLLGRWPCVRVEEIEIFESPSGSFGVAVYVNRIGIDADEKNALAWRDGFRSRGRSQAFAEMMEFWKGRLPFCGDIIHWKYTDARRPAE